MASSWERLFTHTLGSASTTIDTGVLANGGSEVSGGTGILAREHLKIIIDVVPTSSTGANVGMRFNGDNTDKYPIRRNTNGGSDETITNDGYTYWYNGYGGSTSNRHVVLDIINVLNKEKLIVHHQIWSATGAGNATNRIETTGKWAANAQITDVELSSASFSGIDTFDDGTTMTIWGADDDVLNYIYILI